MALEAWSRGELEKWIEKLNKATKNVQKIVDSLDTQKLPSVKLEAKRARDCIEYIADWAELAEPKSRQEMSKEKARMANEEVRAIKEKAT
jgi:hypothetical protein